jgi:pyocin large subunit-like protein
MFIQTDVDNLDAKMAQGARRIRTQDGREFEFISVDEYVKLRNLMLNEIAQQGTTQIRAVRVYTTNGWGE